MKKKLKLTSLILSLLLISSVLLSCGSKPAETASEEQKVLRVGMECDFAPFNWTQLEKTDDAVAMPDGTYADGYDVQIAKLITDSLGMKLEVVKVDWDGLPPSLTSNKIDLIIAGMTNTEERRQTLDFTDDYYSSDLVIVVKKDGPYANATTLAEFAGARITAQMGTLHYDLVDNIAGVNKQQAMKDFPTMLIALTSDKIDGYLSERPSAISAEVSNSDVKYVVFDEGKGFGEEVPVAVGLRQGEDSLKSDINKVLAGITLEQRAQMMEDAVKRQPLIAE
jgi:ABC-type amino acid transport substrate-binding protein